FIVLTKVDTPGFSLYCSALENLLRWICNPAALQIFNQSEPANFQKQPA
ncbi:MAG: hypothetical protein ACI8Q1_001982, partial [Parvicella sp.]